MLFIHPPGSCKLQEAGAWPKRLNWAEPSTVALENFYEYVRTEARSQNRDMTCMNMILRDFWKPCLGLFWDGFGMFRFFSIMITVWTDPWASGRAFLKRPKLSSSEQQIWGYRSRKGTPKTTLLVKEEISKNCGALTLYFLSNPLWMLLGPPCHGLSMRSPTLLRILTVSPMAINSSQGIGAWREKLLLLTTLESQNVQNAKACWLNGLANKTGNTSPAHLHLQTFKTQILELPLQVSNYQFCPTNESTTKKGILNDPKTHGKPPQ